MRTKATSLPTRSEKISAFKLALEYQTIDSYKRLELQTRSYPLGSFTRFLVRSFLPTNARWTVLSLTRSFGYSFARSDVRSLRLPFVRSFAFLVCSVVSPFA